MATETTQRIAPPNFAVPPRGNATDRELGVKDRDVLLADLPPTEQAHRLEFTVVKLGGGVRIYPRWLTVRRRPPVLQAAQQPLRDASSITRQTLDLGALAALVHHNAAAPNLDKRIDHRLAGEPWNTSKHHGIRL